MTAEEESRTNDTMVVSAHGILFGNSFGRLCPHCISMNIYLNVCCSLRLWLFQFYNLSLSSTQLFQRVFGNGAEREQVGVACKVSTTWPALKGLHPRRQRKHLNHSLSFPTAVAIVPSDVCDNCTTASYLLPVLVWYKGQRVLIYSPNFLPWLARYRGLLWGSMA